MVGTVQSCSAEAGKPASQFHVADYFEDTFDVFSTALPFPACTDGATGGLAVVRQLEIPPTDSGAADPSRTTVGQHLVLAAGFRQAQGDVVKLVYAPIPKAPDPLGFPPRLGRGTSRVSWGGLTAPPRGEISSAGPMKVLDGLRDASGAETIFPTLRTLIMLQDTKAADAHLLTLDRTGGLSVFAAESAAGIQMWHGQPKGAASSAAAASPHNVHELASVGTAALEIWDTRACSAKAANVCDIHLAQLDVDYNPNKEFELVTAGEDGNMRFWDTRRLAGPVNKFTKLHEDIWCRFARYNQYHDQLILTAGCNNAVNLWKVGCSSPNKPVPTTAEDTTNQPTPLQHNGCMPPAPQLALIYNSTVHENALSAVCWNDTDPWTFASCGYDRRLCLHQIPAREKYELLL